MEYVKDFELDGDAYGNPRRSNGGMDVGAVEADWRVRYAANFGDRTRIASVSWDAVEAEDKSVVIPDGGRLNAELKFYVPARGYGIVKFAVDEGAKLFYFPL